MCQVKEVSTLNRQGMSACVRGDYPTAISTLSQAEQKAFFMGATTFRGKINYHLGIVHQLSGDQHKARDCYTIAKSIIMNKIGTDNSLYKKITDSLATLNTQNSTQKAA
ncbi:MAG: hypothetical protein ACNI27_10185 [Desulfovibrio sp.]